MLARADEPTRCAQEELRRRHFYFGDINGLTSAELKAAIKSYQERKGLDPTGEITDETAASLNIPRPAVAASHVANQWPDVPVLRSDIGGAGSIKVDAAADPTPPASGDRVVESPAVPADSPPALKGFTHEQVAGLVQAYLRDAATDDVEAQVDYYQFPVEYFDHGALDRAAVTRDTRNYVKRWPQRKYMMTEPVRVTASNKEGEAFVQFVIAFTVTNIKSNVSGRTRNFWTVARQPNGGLKIIAIREERLHD
jgi:hypothetical protein